VIDTHAHLDACADPPADLLSRAREAGVDRVITVGTTIESCRAALETAGRDEGVFATLGVHPHEAGGGEAGRMEELRGLLGHERAVAVGETGLDFFRDYAPRDAQLRLFEQHLELASVLGKPVVIHTRDAEEEVATALAGFEGSVVLHCFSSPQLLPVALERRYYVSFAGNVTFPKADELRAAATQVPADRMLARLAGGTGPKQVTDCYKGLIDALVIDEADAEEDAGIRTIVTRTLMSDEEARRRLADAVLETAGALR
jgi:TatD DNase family protein